MTEIKEVRTIEMMEKIENYILGRLTQEDIDELWMEFLKEPDWYNYFEIELYLRYICKRQGNININL